MRALQIYRDEIDRVLALIGCTSVTDLGPDHVILPD
jgi:isopentenyl diphosphate isomerase/L-lactate dehydrogenase-like FMN-dependent dehydrogenase